MRQLGILAVIIILFALIATAFNIAPRQIGQSGDSDVPTTVVKLYYYDARKDIDEGGNVQCGRDGLVAITRRIREGTTRQMIVRTLELLLRGELSAAERAAGITTEFPLSGVRLLAATTTDRVLTLTFADLNNRTGGGACRAGILWFQIEKTAKQFKGVDEVRFAPDTLFQP